MNDARSRLREATLGDETIFAPLILDPLAGLLAQEFGFKAGYLSGGALGFQYAVSEALLTTTEIADVARRITSRCELPLIVDGGVGFGDPVHVVRAVWEFERAGAAAVEFEDQIAPKRVHHHIGVEHLISTDDMCAKVTAAAEARRSTPPLVCVMVASSVACVLWYAAATPPQRRQPRAAIINATAHARVSASDPPPILHLPLSPPLPPYHSMMQQLRPTRRRRRRHGRTRASAAARAHTTIRALAHSRTRTRAQVAKKLIRAENEVYYGLVNLRKPPRSSATPASTHRRT